MTHGKKVGNLGALEQLVMDHVWASGPATAESVREALHSRHAMKDSTVRTVLRRLEEKGFLRHEVDGRTFVYRAVQGRRNLAARAVSQHHEVDAIICLGVILKGETPHNDYIAREVARGISQIHAATGIPATFGVLTPNTMEQAKARAGGTMGNKGIEAAEAALAMIHLLNEIKQGTKKQNKSVGF